MTRPTKPIDLHIAKGNPNGLTKEETERRQQGKIKPLKGKLKCPEYLKNDVVAFAKMERDGEAFEKLRICWS